MTLTPPPDLQEGVLLSDHTTLALGGPARFFLRVRSVDDLRPALAFAQERHLPVLVLGGGSNLVVRDHGFPGLVVRIDIRGKDVSGPGPNVTVTAGAGEPWDELVAECVERGLGGIECLSGIPGLVGATPIQNVGAYGQEVSDTIRSVQVMDRQTLALRDVPAHECGFGYRSSRFKRADAGRFVVTSVTFSLSSAGRPTVKYAELERALQERPEFARLPAGPDALRGVRETVLAIRRSKSMVISPDDPNSRSAGSFFLNPVLSESAFVELQERWNALGGSDPIPRFPGAGTVKVPAAWLVERTGFAKGFRIGRAGISTRHSLALVNHSGSAADLLTLADTIERGVFEVFGIRLEREPVVVD